VRPGSEDTETVVPIHEVVGDGSWFRRCPASGILVHPGGAIGTRARVVLRDGAEHFRRMSEDRINARFVAEATAVPREAEPLPTVMDGWLALEARSQQRQEPPDVEDYFPGRPADAPGPGGGEAPDQPVPDNVTAIPYGGRPMDSMRDQLTALIDLAEQGFTNCGDELTGIAEIIDTTRNLLMRVGESSDAAMTIARAAVGMSGALPEPAQNMLDAGAAARESVDAAMGALALLLERVETGRVQYIRAATEAAVYRAIP
jgi:hypothetical protein